MKEFINLSQVINKVERTDIDVCQLCLELSETEYQYWQIKNPFTIEYDDNEKDIELYLKSLWCNDCNCFDTNKLINDFNSNNKLAIQVINDSDYWDWETLRLSDYSEKEQIEYLSSYYTLKEIEKMKKENYSLYCQLVLEAIFETDIVS